MTKEFITRMYEQQMDKHSADNLQPLRDNLARLHDDSARYMTLYAEEQNVDIGIRHLGRYYEAQSDYHCLAAVLATLKGDSEVKDQLLTLSHQFGELAPQR